MSQAMKKGSRTPLSRSMSISIPMTNTQKMELRIKLSNVIFFFSIPLGEFVLFQSALIALPAEGFVFGGFAQKHLFVVAHGAMRE